MKKKVLGILKVLGRYIGKAFILFVAINGVTMAVYYTYQYIV